MVDRLRLPRRKALTMAAVGALAISCGRTTPSRPELFDDLTRAPDGPLVGRRSDSGHDWIAVGGPADDPPVVRLGAIGPPADHVPGRSTAAGDTNPAAAAGYAMLDTGRPTTLVGADVRWDASTSTLSGLAMGAFTPPAVPRVERGERRTSSMHLAVGPTGLLFSVFARGSDVDMAALAPDGGRRGLVPFRTPMRCDGRTTYRVEIALDRDEGTAEVTIDGDEPLTFKHPFIASVPASIAFWEYYTGRGGTNLARFTRVWASTS